MTPTDDERKKAREDMPNMVGTPGTGAYLRSLEGLYRWYEHYFKTIQDALQSAPVLSKTIDVSDVVYSKTPETIHKSGSVSQDGNKDILILRLINLLGDICAQAADDPLRLIAFNSPLLSRAAIEHFQHFNGPSEDMDKALEQIKAAEAKRNESVLPHGDDWWSCKRCNTPLTSLNRCQMGDDKYYCNNCYDRMMKI